MNVVRKVDENKGITSNLVDLKKIESYKKDIKNIFVVKDVDKIEMAKGGVKRFIDIEYYKRKKLTPQEYTVLLQYLDRLEQEYTKRLQKSTITQETNNTKAKEETKESVQTEQEATNNHLDTYRIAIRNCFVWKDARKVRMVRDATIRLLERDYASHKIEKQEYDILLEYLQSLNEKYEKLLQKKTTNGVNDQQEATEKKLSLKQQEKMFREKLKCTTEKKELQFIPMMGREGWGKDIFRDRRALEEK